MSQQPARSTQNIPGHQTPPPRPQAGDRYDLRTANERIAARLNDLARRLARQSVNVLALSEETRRLGAEVAPERADRRTAGRQLTNTRMSAPDDRRRHADRRDPGSRIQHRGDRPHRRRPGASYHAIATPGATPADEARGLVELVRSAMINSAIWRP